MWPPPLNLLFQSVWPNEATAGGGGNEHDLLQRNLCLDIRFLESRDVVGNGSVQVIDVGLVVL